MHGNRYEWTNRSAETIPAKEIFIRDIWLSWYSRGINSEVNSIEKLINYLKKETEGYDIVTVGVSSGGYIAAILASELCARLCFDFSGQFSLENHFDHVERNPFLKATRMGGYIEAYRVIQGSDTNIFYFLPSGCEQDRSQARYTVGLDNVYKIEFASSHHGVTVFSVSLPKVISMNTEELMQLYKMNKGKQVNQILFSVRISGLWKTGIFLIKRGSMYFVTRCKKIWQKR